MLSVNIPSPEITATSPPSTNRKSYCQGSVRDFNAVRIEQKIDISKLRPDKYEALLLNARNQIGDTISKSVQLHHRQKIITYLLLGESIVFLVINSFGTLTGISKIDEGSKIALLYVVFALGVIASSASMLIKWLQSRQTTSIEGYRNTLKGLVDKFGEDASYVIIKRRLSLDADVLAHGFFDRLV